MHDHTCGPDCHCEDGLDLQAITLDEITSENLNTVMKLAVKEAQLPYVAPNAVSIAQAHYTETAWFRAICYDHLPVGFVMLDLNEALPEYYLWRFMVDEKFQKAGVGTKALELVKDYVRTLPNAEVLWTSFKLGEASPESFFKHSGFEPTAETTEDEKLYSCKL